MTSIPKVYILLLVILSGPEWLFSQTKQVVKYYDIAELQVKESFDFNIEKQVPDGVYRKYHQNGSPAITGEFYLGLPSGKWTYYYENGALKTDGSFDKGQRNGEWSQYFENGNLKSKGQLINNSQEGLWTYHFENGNIKREGYYDDDEPQGQWNYYYETGPIKAITDYGLEKANHTSYYLGGQLQSKGTKIGTKSTGHWVYYYLNGEKQSEGNYKDGLKDGFWINYHNNGKRSSQGDYRHGERTGDWTYFHPDGSKAGNGAYDHNQKQGDWALLNPNGSLASQANYVNGNGKITYYHSNGQIASSGYMKNGKSDSIWVYYDHLGNKIGNAIFDQGNGMYTGYHPNGVKSVSGQMQNQKRVGEWEIFDEKGNSRGSYYPVYQQSAAAVGGYESKLLSVEDSTSNIEAQISEYRYQKKSNRYFDEVINEFDGIILSTNPLMMLIDHLPISIEYYQQERLGYELQYHFLKSPFLVPKQDIEINQIYHIGHLVNLRQKFYSRAQLAGMYYFGHQIQWTIFQNRVMTQADGGFREIFTSYANESLFTYGWFVGWKWMQDAGDVGFTIDSYLGFNIGIRDWKNRGINDDDALEIFAAQNQDSFATPISFGVNFGYAKQIKRKKRRRRNG